ncbi:MAG: hypothetical protein EPN93_00025 [Spirochaetes bacterium]|nr:MAG: hypothetical protein EPN93_00025 [Spirochaetota bacterium]
MQYDPRTLAFLFIFYSMCGWCIESFYRSVNARAFVNPGFLRGPYVPLYGTGAIVILAVCALTADFSLTARMAVYFFSISLLELAVGEAMLRLFGRRLWDYRDERFNIRGHVCPGFSLYWVVLALIFENTVYPVTVRLMARADSTLTFMFSLAAGAVMAVDLFYSSGAAGASARLVRETHALIRGGRVWEPGRAFASLWTQVSLPGEPHAPRPQYIGPLNAARAWAGKRRREIRGKFRSALKSNGIVRGILSRAERP